MRTRLSEMEEDTFYEDNNPELPPSDIVAYNELRSCADLFRMWNQGILNIQPEFQREVVWKGPDQTRFIDSLIKQLPIPSMCFSLDFKTQRWQVIDGLQRMSTITRFLSGQNWTLSNLDDIEPEIAGKSVAAFQNPKSKLHDYYTRVENLTLPITVIRCDDSKKNHSKYLFTIFHRLNTGGMKLNNQEIRNCIYSGSFNTLLKELDKNVNWMKLNRMKPNQHYRFTKQEIILRFFSFYTNYSSYTGYLSHYLNDFMAENRNPDEIFLNEKREIFSRTVDLIYQKIFEGKIDMLSISVLEALLVGVSLNIDYLEQLHPQKVREIYGRLMKHEEFTEQKLSEGLAQKTRLIGRLAAAQTIFSGK